MDIPARVVGPRWGYWCPGEGRPQIPRAGGDDTGPESGRSRDGWTALVSQFPAVAVRPGPKDLTGESGGRVGVSWAPNGAGSWCVNGTSIRHDADLGAGLCGPSAG